MVLNKMIEKNLGSSLVQDGLITLEQWQNILSIQSQSGKDARKILVEEGLVTAQELAIVTAMEHDIPFVNINQQKIENQALLLIPESMARKYNAIPIKIVDGALVVAMENPGDIRAIEDLTAQARMTIKQVESVPSDIQDLINRSYKVSSEVEKQISHIYQQKDREARVSSALITETPVARAVDLIIGQAVKDRASDVHIEAQEDRLRIRYRIDGILHDAMSLPLNVHLPLISPTAGGLRTGSSLWISKEKMWISAWLLPTLFTGRWR
jgi:type IV pilus assembly protein PilB